MYGYAFQDRPRPVSRILFFTLGEQFELHLRAAAGPKHSTSITSSGSVKKHVLHHVRKAVQRGMYDMYDMC